MSNNKQSSVEWLFNQIKNHIDAEDGSMSMNWLHNGTLQQAKAMHEQEITDAHTTGYIIGGGNGDIYEPKQYYNETFNTHENNNRI